MYRKTFVQVNLVNFKKNIENLINKYNDYKYYFAVIKADCYGHGLKKTIKAILSTKVNYLAVSSIEEALNIRKTDKNIPILIILPIDYRYVNICIKNNITITVTSLKDLEKIANKKVKIHFRINSGNDDINSFNDQNEITEAYNLVLKSNIILEGIYTHIFCAPNKNDTIEEFKRFEYLTNKIDLKNIPIVHIPNSEALVKYKKLDYVNGFRMGAVMYGINNLDYLPTFKLISHIISVRTLKKDETIGYDKCYKAKEDNERIGIISIGYGDGFSKKNKGSYVYINDYKYLILGVFMDLTIVLIDDKVNLNDEVVLIKDNKHLDDIANHSQTVFEEITCSINSRVPRIYLDN